MDDPRRELPPDVELGRGDDSSAELHQIRLFLVRDDVDVPGDVIRPAENSPHTVHHVDAHGIRGQLVIAAPRERVPDWVPFLEGLAGADIGYAGNRHLSAVLFIERGGRTFALTFGFGRHLLRPDALEPEYGLRTAAGLIDPNAIASIDSRAFEATVLQVRRQSSRGTGTRGIGFDVGREMLRALAGGLLDESLGTRITGSDSLGLTGALDAPSLGPRIDVLHAAYTDRRYQRSFEYLDRWRQLKASEPIRAELDVALLRNLERRREALQANATAEHMPGERDGPRLAAPQVIEYNASGFVTSVERHAVPHPFPDIDAYLLAAGRPPTIEDLRRNHDLLLMAGEPFAVQEVWPLYHALMWEVDLGGDTYVLAEGVWWQVDAAFRERIDLRLQEIPESTLERPDFDPVEDEPDYNIRLAAAPAGERALIDRLTARFDDEEGGAEPCDVFTLQRQFIHVKRATSSAALSHLFGQGLVGARLFAGSSEFRDYLRGKLAGLPDIAGLVPEAKPTTTEYTIILAIITRDPEREGGGHVALSLPFFARNFLFHVATQIESLGYRLEMVRVPVVAGARPASAGPVLRLRNGGDPYPIRWGSQPRRRRRTRRPAAPATEAPHAAPGSPPS